MIRSIIFSVVLVSFLLPRMLFSQDVFLRSQADVDAFDPATIVINGNLTIGKDIYPYDSDIKDLSNLSNLTTISGGLSILSNDSLTNLDGLSNLTSISGVLYIGVNDSLTNLDGLSNLTSISGGLSIDNNDALANIDGLSNLSTISVGLYFSNNDALANIDGLSNLTTISGDLNIYNNDALTNLDGLSNLTSISGGLSIYNNDALTNLDGLSNLTSILGSLSIIWNEALINVDGLSNLTTISGYLFIWGNKALPNLDGLSNVTTISGYLEIFNNAALTNLDGLSNVTTISGYLKIRDNDALTNVDGFLNLTTISGYLYIGYNSALTNCCGIKELLNTPGAIGGQISIFSNPSECSNIEEILYSDCYDFNYAEGKVYYDGNENGCDTLDIHVPNLKFIVKENSSIRYVISNTEGKYRFLLNDTSDVMIVPLIDSTLYKIEPDTLIISLPEDNLNLVNDFCITPVKVFNDLEVSIIPLIAAVPGFDTRYEIDFKSKGTTTMSGKVELYFEEDLVSYVISDPVEDSIIGNKIVWNFTDLLPFEERKIIVTMKLNTPTDDPPLNNGDVLSYTASIYPVQEDATPDDNIFKLNQTVVNSFDPNDKTCLEGNVFDIENIGGYVNYLIRFENQGTADAVNIKVIDVIDPSLFDISTLTITSSSHSCLTNINKDTVEFIFDNIFLPFDAENNDGYVAFKIKTWPTLTSGTILKNEANIYFDYNLPVKTNIATTIVKEIVSTNETDRGQWQIFPNPAKGNFFISTDLPGNYQISIYNTNGKLIYASLKYIKNYTELVCSDLSSGLYLMRIYNKDGIYHSDKVMIFNE